MKLLLAIMLVLMLIAAPTQPPLEQLTTLTVTDRRPTSRHVLGPAMAPFFLAGTMQRGEVRLAVILPPDARYLNQTAWLRPGEQWRGWRNE